MRCPPVNRLLEPYAQRRKLYLWESKRRNFKKVQEAVSSPRCSDHVKKGADAKDKETASAVARAPPDDGLLLGDE
jgi:hypothetical protein